MIRIYMDNQLILSFRKRRRATTRNTRSGTESLGHYEYGRYYARAGDFFLKVDQVVNCGLVEEAKESDDEMTPLVPLFLLPFLSDILPVTHAALRPGKYCVR